MFSRLQVMHYPQCNLHPPEKVCTDEKCHVPRIQITRHIISEVKKLFFEKEVRWWAGVEIITKGAVRVQSTHINGRCIDCFPFGGGGAERIALVRCKHFSSPGREFFSIITGPRLLFHHVEYTNSCKRWLINQGVAAQKSNIPAGKYLRVGKKNKKIKKKRKTKKKITLVLLYREWELHAQSRYYSCWQK